MDAAGSPRRGADGSGATPDGTTYRGSPWAPGPVTGGPDAPGSASGGGPDAPGSAPGGTPDAPGSAPGGTPDAPGSTPGTHHAPGSAPGGTPDAPGSAPGTPDAPGSASGGAWLRPSRRLLRLRRTELLGVAALTLLATAGPSLVAGSARLAAAFAVGVAVLTGLAWLVVRRRWAAWGYAERAEDLLVRRGVLVRRLSVVPYGRMQYVDVTAGPLDRRYGLATVHLHTAAAASDARIPGLPSEEAGRLRDRLAALGEARAAGL